MLLYFVVMLNNCGNQKIFFYLLGSLLCYLFIFKMECYLLMIQGMEKFLIPPIVLQMQAKNVGIYLP